MHTAAVPNRKKTVGCHGAVPHGGGGRGCEFMEATRSELAQDEAIDPRSSEWHRIQESILLDEWSFTQSQVDDCRSCANSDGIIFPHRLRTDWTITDIRRPSLQEANVGSDTACPMQGHFGARRPPTHRQTRIAAVFATWSSCEYSSKELENDELGRSGCVCTCHPTALRTKLLARVVQKTVADKDSRAWVAEDPSGGSCDD